jgi:hypothetical protein
MSRHIYSTGILIVIKHPKWTLEPQDWTLDLQNWTFDLQNWSLDPLAPPPLPHMFQSLKQVASDFRGLDFVPGQFRILEMAPFSDFQELTS